MQESLITPSSPSPQSRSSGQLPNLESHIRAQETLTTLLHEHLVDMSQGIAESLQKLTEAQKESESAMMAEMATVKTEIGNLKIAITTMESKILGAFEQFIRLVSDPMEQRIHHPGTQSRKL